MPSADILLVASTTCNFDATTFNVNVTNYFQDITRKMFPRQLTVPTLFDNTCCIKERYFIFFLRILMLLAKCLIRRNQIPSIVNFTMNQKINHFDHFDLTRKYFNTQNFSLWSFHLIFKGNIVFIFFQLQ